MAISYTNIINDKVLEPIRLFIRTEFPAMAVYIGGFYEKRGNVSVRIECLNQDINSLGSSGYENEYTVGVTYYLLASNFAHKTVMDKMYTDVSRLEQLLFNKKDQVSRSSDGAYYGGTVTSIAYNQKTAEEEEVDGLLCAKLEYLCYYTKMS